MKTLMYAFIAILSAASYNLNVNESLEVTFENKTAKAEFETDRAIVKQIVRNKPKINKKIAKQLAALINKYSAKYSMDPHRAAAIAMQESGYRSVINKNKDKSIDVGYFQINSKTAKAYKMNLKRLLNNLDYSVEAYFIVMSDKIKSCAKRSNSWGCYHSKRPDLKNKYVGLVNRYYISSDRKVASL